MSERPKPPSEHDLPEELSIGDVPTGPASANGDRRSQGMLGILIAAVLGSVTAIGMFFVIKPHLLPHAPSPAPEQIPGRTPPAAAVRDEPGRQNPERETAVDVSVQTADLSPEGDRNQTKPSATSSPAAASDGDSDPTGEPFPGLNARLNQVIPIESDNAAGPETENRQQTIPEPVVQHPRPDEDAVAQAIRDLDAVFSQQLRNSKTREEKVALVSVLKRAAEAEPAGSATRFALFQIAHDLAVDAPDPVQTDELVSVISAEYDVDPFEYRLSALETWDRMRMPDMEAAAERQTHRLLARKAATLGDQAYVRNDYKTAAVMYALASKRRDRADDKQIADLFGKKRTAARTQETRQNLASSLLESLKETPGDAEKNLETGLACVRTGLWNDGLECLSKGSDETLKDFATGQLKLRANPASRLQAGDHSWDAVRQLGRRHALWLKELAVADYESVLTDLTPLQLQKVRLRVAEVGPVSCVLAVPIQYFAFEPDDFAVIQRVKVVLNRMGHFGNGRLDGNRKLEPGIRGSSLTMDGRETMVVCPQSEYLIPGDSPFTLSLWINARRSQTAVIAGRMFPRPGASHPDFGLRMAANGRIRAFLSSEAKGEVELESQGSAPLGDWVHLALTWDLHRLKLYVDGREDGSLEVSPSHLPLTLANRSWMAVGSNQPAKNRVPRFDGRVDEVRLYDQALSPLQIMHVYLEDQTPAD